MPSAAKALVAAASRLAGSSACRRICSWGFAVGVSAAGVVGAAAAVVVAGQAAGVAVQARKRVGAARWLAGWLLAGWLAWLAWLGWLAGLLHGGLAWQA
jgi:hypothetical protein